MRIDARENRRRIIAAYRTVAVERGGEANMDDVAAAAGVTRVTLYRHFTDRDSLRRAAQREILDDVGGHIRAALVHPQPVRPALAAVVRICLDRLRLWEAVHVSTDNVDQQLRRTWTAVVRPVVDLVRAGQESGELRSDVPATWLVDTLMWSMQSATASGAFTAGHDPAEVVLSTFLDGARHGCPSR